MDNLVRNAFTKSKAFYGLLSLAVAGGLLPASCAVADDPTPLAPPIETSAPPTSGADNVFSWKEVPANQPVPLTRAAFDQGGYQLYDTAGETIVVPFTNQNLYVMKFAQSGTGRMYFENEDGYPVLYVPRSGYLENAAVAGARWYPFGKDFHPSTPVFLGIAPSWSGFIGMGWYPNMYCYGGYWGHRPYIASGVFLASVGLFFEIGGHPYYGWNGYHRYFQAHPAHYHIAYFRRGLYRTANVPRGPQRRFIGAGRPAIVRQTFTGAHNLGGGRVFRGVSGTRRGKQAPTLQREFNGGARGPHEFVGGRGVAEPHTLHGSTRGGAGQHSFRSRARTDGGGNARGRR